MARKRGVLNALVQAQREAERKRTNQIKEMEKAQTQAAKDAEKTRKDYESARIAGLKEQTRLYTESRVTQVQLQNEQVEQEIRSLEHLLLDSLAIDPYIDIQTLKQTPNFPPFNPGPIAFAEAPPQPQMYAVPALTGWQRFMTSAKEKYAQEVAKGQEVYVAHIAEHAARETARQQSLAQAKKSYDQQIVLEQQKIVVQHEEVDTLQREIQAGSPQAIIEYFSMVLSASMYPEEFPQGVKLAYVPSPSNLSSNMICRDLRSFPRLLCTNTLRRRIVLRKLPVRLRNENPYMHRLLLRLPCERCTSYLRRIVWSCWR